MLQRRPAESDGSSMLLIHLFHARTAVESGESGEDDGDGGDGESKVFYGAIVV